MQHMLVHAMCSCIQLGAAGYGNSLDAFAWDRRDPQLAPSFSQFANPGASNHRDVHPSVLAEQMLGTSSLPKELGRYDSMTSASITRQSSLHQSFQCKMSSLFDTG